jgi:quercetin dioxygenase-like cupin family protein
MKDCENASEHNSDADCSARRLVESWIGDLEKFSSEFWDLSFMYRPKSSDIELPISIDDVDAWLGGSGGLRPEYLRIAKDGRAIPRTEYIRQDDRSNLRSRVGSPRRAADPSNPSDPDAVLLLLERGASTIFQAAHKYSASLATICSCFELILGQACHVNVYITPPGSRALDRHTDPHHVFVLQIVGSKSWEVGGQDANVQALTLTPGDVLYMPPGVHHLVESRDDWSIHLTLGASAYTEIDILREYVARRLWDIQSSSVGGRSLPVGWHSSPQVGAGERIKSVLDKIDFLRLSDRAVEEVTSGAAERFVSARRTAKHGSLRGLVEGTRES